MTTLVLDNTPLSHFARAGLLAVLEALTAGFRCVAPDEVIKELARGLPTYPTLSAAMALPWVEVVELTALDEVVAFAGYKAELGGGPTRNNGEAAVLAWARLHGGVAIIDESAASGMAARDGIPVRATLWLIVDALRRSDPTVPDKETAAAIVDDLAATGMALSTDGAGLLAWAYKEGLLP